MNAIVVLSLVVGQGYKLEPPEDKFPDLPPLAVLKAFAWSNGDAREQVRRHDKHLSYLKSMLECFPAHTDHINNWQKETADRCALWCKLANATATPLCEVPYSEEEKRKALQHLKIFLGYEQFWKGQMPSPLGVETYVPLCPPKYVRNDSLFEQ